MGRDHTSIIIPISRGQSALVVEYHELDSSIISILRIESPPLTSWLEVAAAFLHRGDVDGFKRVLETAVDEATNEKTRRRYSSGSRFDLIQVMCSLAALYLHEGRISSDRSIRAERIQAANNLFMKASIEDTKEQLPIIGQGQVMLLKNDVKSARSFFQRAQKLTVNGNQTIIPILALASIEFNYNKNYTTALRLYSNALKFHPNAPPEVRLGLAACYLKLGDSVKAELAYKRVVDLDPGGNCTQALLGLAVIKLNAGARAETLKEGSQLLVQAFHQDPDNPYVLVLLAHFSLQQGFQDQAARLAEAAFDRAETADLRAEAKTVLGRAKHALGDLKAAYQAYQQAVTLSPKAPLPRFGLAQFSAYQGELTNAASALEGILDQNPGWLDALELLGKLYPRLPSHREPRAAPSLKAACERFPDRADLWELLGDVTCATQPSSAMQNYMKAINIHQKKISAKSATGTGTANVVVPARLYNNAAVLHLQAGNAAMALRLMENAMASVAAGGLGDLGPLSQVTLGFNMARVKEANGELGTAEKEYKALLEQFPDYTDCLLRLSCIAHKRGDVEMAEEWARKAAQASDMKNMDAMALLANIFLEKNDLAQTSSILKSLNDAFTTFQGGNASKAAKQQMAVIHQKEAYVKLLEANVQLKAIKPEVDSAEAIARTEKSLGYAAMLCKRVLEKNENNVYAANGLGCVLGESGRLREAKEVFAMCQEVSAASEGFITLPDAWVNLGTVHASLGEYTRAVEIYTSALKRFYGGGDVRLMLYIARSLYGAGQGIEARKWMSRALHIDPKNYRYWFNLAFVITEHAGAVFGEDSAKKTQLNAEERFNRLAAAWVKLENAHRIFEHLHTLGRDNNGNISVESLLENVNFAATQYDMCRPILHAAENEKKGAELRRRQQQTQMEAAKIKQKVEEMRKAAQVQQQAAMREEQYKQQKEKLEAVKAKWKNQETVVRAAAAGDAEMLAKSRRQAKKNADVDALFADDDEEGDFEYQPGQESDDDAAGGGEKGHVDPEAALRAAEESEEGPDLDDVFGSDDDADEGDDDVDFGSGDGGGDNKKKMADKEAKKAAKRAAKLEKLAAKKKAENNIGGDGGRLKRAREEGDAKQLGGEGDAKQLGGEVAATTDTSAQEVGNKFPKKAKPNMAAVLDDSEDEEEEMAGGRGEGGGGGGVIEDSD